MKKEKQLYNAIQSQNTEKVSFLLSEGVDVSYIYNKPLLHTACNNGNVPIVKLLLNHGANVNQLDKSGNTALFYAVNAIKYNYNILTINERTFTQQELSQLNNDNEHELLQLLIEGGIDVNIKNHLGHVALGDACFEGNLKTVQFLIDNGAKANATCLDGVNNMITANAHQIIYLCRNNPDPEYAEELKQADIRSNYIQAWLTGFILTGFSVATKYESVENIGSLVLFFAYLSTRWERR